MTDDEYVAEIVRAALAAGVSREEVRAALAAGWPWPAHPAGTAPWLIIRPLTAEEMLSA